MLFEHTTTAASIDVLLEEARAGLTRLTPDESLAAIELSAGLIVDIRSEVDRERHGLVPGAHFVARNVIEWRFDPATEYHDPVLVAVEGPLVLMCMQGYQSSLAAAALQRLGVHNATDMIGGFESWLAEGLPIAPR